MTTVDTSLIPAQAVEAEQAALGSMMLEREAIDTALEMHLTPEQFYQEKHRQIMRGIIALVHDFEPVDLITVGTWLTNHGQLDVIGGTLYLTTLMSNAPTAAGMRWYTEKVQTAAKLRAIQRLGETLTLRALQALQALNTLSALNALKTLNALCALNSLRSF
jgi:replicative DNA helicase